MSEFVPESSIASSAQIDATVRIGRFCLIEDGVRIGRDSIIGDFCIIRSGTTIGPETRVMNFVELREDTRIGVNCYIDSGVKSSGSCSVGDRVTIRYDAILARGCVIENDVYISPQVMFINVDPSGNAIGGALVGSNCFIGTNATIQAGVTICPGVVVGAKALVTRSLDQPGTYVGSPARLQ